jgi:hypothetical protein
MSNPFEKINILKYNFFSDDKDETLGIQSIGIRENSVNLNNIKNTKDVYKYYQSSSIIDAQGNFHENVNEYDRSKYQSSS